MAVLQDLREANDHTMINEYFDAIEKLVTLVMEGHGQQAKEEGLCDAVLHLQEVGGSEELPCASAECSCCTGRGFCVQLAEL
jgi:hypothetical protein